MKKIYITLILFAGIVTAQAQDTFEHLIFTARLDTSQVMGTLSPSSGNGVAGLTYHDDSLWIDMTVNGLTGPIIASHIHTGYAGSNGGVVYDLTPFISGNKIKGVLTGISIENGELGPFLEGGYYVNVHTTANPAGEIRGQIWPETDRNYRAQLDLTQAGNPGSTAFGLASFNLSLDQSELEVRMLVNGLSGAITNAHLHYGSPGVSGPVAIPLMTYADGNVFQGVIELGSVTDPIGFLDSLAEGKVYANVHTAMYPAGEIRGQLYLTRPVSFDNQMSSSEEPGGVNPSTPVNAAGLCNLYVNSGMDSLWVTVQADQLSGPIQGAHFHAGDAGENGPIAVDLSDYIDGNRIAALLVEGDPEFTGLDFDNFVNEALKGKIYINLHTALNPGGEVRGQVTKLAREGAVFSLCSAQETGAVQGAGTGIGSGMITLDRNFDNLHYAIAVSGLSSTVVGAHFHHALPGVNGPIVYDLPTDSVMTGSWNDDTFTPEIADWFESGEIYANFHTQMNPGGEVRGQVADGMVCDNPLGVPQAAKVTAGIAVWPNPASSVVTISVNLSQSADVTVKLYNILGSEVATLSRGYLGAGTHQERFDASSLPGGVYLYTMAVNGNVTRTGKMVVEK